MTGKPLLLLDIDGVLCPETLDGALPAGCEWLGVSGGRVPFDGRNLDRLRRLRSAFDCVWATSWEEEANERIGPAHGLPALPVICLGSSADAPFGTTWKLAAVATFAGERPLAWVDDDLWEDAFAWAAVRSAAGVPTLLLRPEPRQGWTAVQVDELLAFAATV